MLLAYVQIRNIYINLKKFHDLGSYQRNKPNTFYSMCKIQASVMKKKNALSIFNVWKSLRTSEAHSAK